MPGTATIAWIKNTVLDVSIFSSVALGTASSSAVYTLLTVPPNTLLVLTVGCNASIASDFTISGGGLTWTKQVDASGTNTGIAEIWTAPFIEGGTISVTATRPSGDKTAGTLYAVISSESTVSGAENTEANGAAPSVSVTTTKVNSILFGITSDWNGVDGVVRTLRDTATETLYYRIDGGFTCYVYYKQCTTAASHTLGVSSPSGQVATTAVLEIRGSA